MKKILFLLFAIAAITSCSKKTNVSTIRPNNASSEVDSIVANKTDTLNTVEAVKNQVNAVYAYWNEQRQQTRLKQNLSKLPSFRQQGVATRT